MWRVNDIPKRNALLFPDEVGIVDDNRRLTWREIYSEVRALAGGLARLGINNGDRACLIARNRAEFGISLFALAELGAALVPVNYYFKHEELIFAVKDSGSRVLIFSHEFADVVEAARPHLPELEHFIALDSPHADWALSLQDVMAGGPGGLGPAVATDPEHPVVFLYTSGTTARPKGAVHTNRSTLMWAYQVFSGLSQGDVAVCVMPLFNTLVEFFIMLSTLGVRMVLRPKFDSMDFLNTIEMESATYVEVVPTMLYKILEESDISRRKFPSLKRLLYTGAAMPEPLLRRTMKAFPGVALYQWYGANEVGILAQLNPDDHRESLLTSVGQPLFNVDLRLVDDDGNDVEEGEIICHSPSAMAGYYNRPDLNAESYFGDWYRTGDVGRFDSAGYLHISGRKKEIIISGGQNISTREIEELLHSHPSVGEAAIVALPDAKWGEIVCAAVVARPGAKLNPEEVRIFCSGKLAAYKVPKQVFVIDSLPRNDVGKVQKRELVQMLRPPQ